MSEIKWLKWFFISCLFSIIFVAFVNYTIDPFQQFRITSFYDIKFEEQRYLNAGLAKNYEINSVVIGTSMTENFLINEIEEKLKYKNTIKLSISGGVAKEQITTLNTAIKHNKIDDVLVGLDIFSLSDNFDKNRFPWFLYEEYSFKLIKDYLLNSFISKNSYKYIKNIMYNSITGGGITINLDLNCMYCWSLFVDDSSYSKENIYKSWNENKSGNIHSNRIVFADLKENFDKYWLTTIKENQNIKFKIFFPPYSILFFKKWESMNVIKDAFKFKEYALNELLKFENVEIYDFQIDKNITHNLSLYKDISHYHQKINTLMLEYIKEHKYLVTNENYKSLIEDLKNQVKDYQLPDFITQENFKKE
ncbi:hypothetical protein CPIN17262_1457 [Campylobacter pinnipediorum subsp. pinnipediorum]|uniref:hypothetical protein n=1 Tax=Campylobacter pinnipediorum TaxID=1965231 RepID=UPI000994B34B|nr:hypothetical protein [Campylobacter pinnipediorum]AQW85122.1 hypothetical protein CPIN17262_1457 [Campylobacter pinnipediorum subsp. pinnipediorum]